MKPIIVEELSGFVIQLSFFPFFLNESFFLYVATPLYTTASFFPVLWLWNGKYVYTMDFLNVDVLYLDFLNTAI